MKSNSLFVSELRIIEFILLKLESTVFGINTEFWLVLICPKMVTEWRKNIEVSIFWHVYRLNLFFSMKKLSNDITPILNTLDGKHSSLDFYRLWYIGYGMTEILRPNFREKYFEFYLFEDKNFSGGWRMVVYLCDLW